MRGVCHPRIASCSESCVSSLVKEIHVVIPANPAVEQLSALASHLLARREAILEAWRAAGNADGENDIASSLSRAQFNDHIPKVLDCLAHRIQDGRCATESSPAPIETETV